MSRDDTFYHVADTIKDLYDHGAPITVSTVARAAGVARGTIYNDPLLRKRVEDFRLAQRGYRHEEAVAKDDANLLRECWARGVFHLDGETPLTPELLRAQLAKLSMMLHPDRGGVTSYRTISMLPMQF